ncbi:MAG: glycosyltransferase family protein [Actinomycetes bacterium]
MTIESPPPLRVVAIVQARTGSTRLPRKVLTDICGISMLERIVIRLRRSLAVDEVVVATTTLTQDDEIAEACKQLGVEVIRGSSDDVLGRYALAAGQSHADIVVRITADCPFIDPELVSEVVQTMIDGAGSIDYVSNSIDPRSYPRGLDVEAFSIAALRETDRDDTNARTREHVTPFMRESGRFRVASVRTSEDLSAIRWTVDTAEDLEAIRLLAQACDGRTDIGWHELLELWRANPQWQQLNAHIEQKEIERDSQ